ncbi:hypothetical protein MKW98_022905 [Papaver atlanticum]|uniref:Uncharacterized protein n=1 Tax=Papaver atlanticum TaxID=357466 RepID=A0AAD4TIL7_9MAGN|nr:hypothetical protein MKW98_022905 [Papaver atlanticum]
MNFGRVEMVLHKVDFHVTGFQPWTTFPLRVVRLIRLNNSGSLVQVPAKTSAITPNTATYATFLKAHSVFVSKKA